MLRWASAVVLAAVVSGFAVLLVTGEYLEDGPVVTRLSWNHGVHLGDLFVLAGWAVAMLAVLHLLRLTRPADVLSSAVGETERDRAAVPGG
ncbi:hypothetical protein GB931_11710 [Modestobacter sp. I12A-02628]|uniref:Uncharacterized protein n=1 Tax=Goekera deserti TaxID=2497753 RepID=A0A7K3WCE8_9ACTN|nr:hypothetical protein [Goekera deserti]MPQ98572.1 hypothetical protein [Goekera deserti]NDI49058.1 hypothetical protein [Goekera deserti]NEL54151.1 hypothetical protein [Goekera deserti]